MDYSSYLTVTEFSKKYNMTANNVRGFISRKSIPDFALKFDSENKMYYLLESYFIENKRVLDLTRFETQFNFTYLVDRVGKSALARIISILSNGFFTLDRARQFSKEQLFDFKDTSILACTVSSRTYKYFIASEKLMRICKLIGSFSEDKILNYLHNELNISINDSIYKNKYTYKVYCSSCKEYRTLAYNPRVKSKKCKKCSSRELQEKLTLSKIKKEEDKVKYFYFCPSCSSVRIKRAKNGSLFCIKCNKKHSYKNKDKFVFCFKEIKMIKVSPRYFAVCTDCEPEVATRQVANKQDGGYKKCRKHKVSKTRIHPAGTRKKSTYVKKTKVKKEKKPTTYQQVGTDGAVENKVTVSFAKHKQPKQKFQVVDFDTMEAPVKKRKEKEIPKSTPEQEADMMAKFFEDGGKVTKL